MRTVLAIVLLAASCGMRPAVAADKPLTMGQKLACAPDYFRLCSQHPLSDPAGIRKCMVGQADRKQLSKECVGAFSKK